jgi:hypothetical protein
MASDNDIAAPNPPPVDRGDGERPEGRRGSGWLRRLLLSALFLLLAGVVTLSFRVDIVNRFGPEILSRIFDAPIAFDASSLDWRGSVIERVDLGTDGAVRAEGVRLSYDPLALRLSEIAIDRVVVSAEIGDRFSLGSLDPVIDGMTASEAGDAAGPLPTLPRIIVKSIELELRSPLGVITGRGEATLDNQAVVASFTLDESNGAAALACDVALSLAPDGAAPTGSLSAHLGARSALWRFLGLAPPEQGDLAVEAQLRTDMDWQRAGWIEADWRLTASAFQQALLPAPLTGSVAAKSRLDQDGLAILGLVAEMAGGLAPDWQSRLEGEFALHGIDTAPTMAGRLALSAHGPNLALQPLGAGDITLAGPDLALAVEIAGSKVTDGGVELALRLTEPGKISARGIAVMGQLRLPQTGLALLPGEAPLLTLVQDGAGRVVSTVTALLEKTSLTLEPGASAERLILTMPRSGIAINYDSAPAADGKTLRVDFKARGAQAVLPTRGIALGGVAVAASLADGRSTLSLTSEAVTGLGAFVPVRAEGKASLAGNDARFDLRFRGVDQPIDLALRGRADLDRLRGEVTLALAPIDFAIGGLQPYNLFPPLRSYLADVSGRIEASGPIRFDGSKLASDLKLGIEKFSGKVGPVQLFNVNSVISIDRPWPLSTRPDQALAVERADIGLPLTGALFRFKVSDGRRLDLAESRLTMSGGEVRMDPVSLDIDAPVHNLKLTVTQVSVNELFASLGIAGLSGEGTLSGAVPVSLFPGGIAIPAAELKADAPGVLRYDRTQAPLALQSAGESVAMALLALSDFHYKELILRLSRALTGDVDLGLHISGSNPSFYDGYPVEFNLTVQGRLDEALRQGLAGYQVPDMIREQLENLSP